MLTNRKAATRANFLVRSTLFTGLVFLMLAFVAQAQTIDQLSYTGAWGVQGLQGTQGAANSGIAAFITTPNNQIHVFYRGVDQHIHQRFPSGSGSWVDEDLTAQTHAPSTDPYSYVTGFSVQNFQYVFYADVNDHIHQLLYNNSNWSDSDITELGGGATWYAIALCAISTTPNNQVHVFYLSPDADVHQLFFNGTQWSDLDLTIATRSGQGENIPWSGIAAVSIGNYQYAFYVARNESIHEMYYNNAGWTDINLTNSAGAAFGLIGNLAALVIPGTQTIKLYYQNASSTDMMELTTPNNVNWAEVDLTRLAGGTVANPNPAQLVAFATTPNNQLHVYYAGENLWSDTDLHQLYFNGSRWSDEDLTAETHSAGIYSDSGMAGFAIGNSQYIFYGQ